MAKANHLNAMRQRIASQAARLMAVDGIHDFGHAKRKAARQLGAPSTEALPNNGEIERELRAYQGLYQQEEHSERLAFLREHALQAMRLLEQFNPYLTGSVLRGTAGRYAAVDLQLFVDSSKEVELFLLNQHLPYKVTELHHRKGNGMPHPMVMLEVDFDHVIIKLYIFHLDDERRAFKNPRDGSVIERARIPAVVALVEGEK